MSIRLWRVGAAVAVLALVVLLVLAVFPWGLLKPLVEHRLEQRFGRPVAIGRLERLGRFGFAPVLVARDVRVPQPAWAGPGDFLRIASVRVRLPLRTLIAGHGPTDTRIRGLDAVLVRRRDGRANWQAPDGKAHGATEPGAIVIENGRVTYRDAEHDRRFVVRIASDASAGVRAAGTGTVLGTPVRVAFSGPPILIGQGKPWPFQAAITGPALAMNAVGTMDRALDTGRMQFRLSGRARDLRLVGAMIEAELFGTQPVAFAARIRHRPARWTIAGLKGTVGRSDVAANLTVDRVGNRTRLDGDVASVHFDSDDLAANDGLARARALRRRIGPRVVPNTPVDLSGVDHLDGVVRVRLGSLTSGGEATGIRDATATLRLDRSLLRVDPLRAEFQGGRAAGQVVVDQRGGRAAPRVTMDLRLTGAEFARMFGTRDITGSTAARIRLAGIGRTIRDAVGAGSGRIALVVRDGALPRRQAYAAGFTPVKALTAGKEERARLRCGVLVLAVSHGRGQARTLLVDTSESQLHGEGSLTFPAETLAFRLEGAAKRQALLRLEGQALAGGTISAPAIIVPAKVKSVGNFLKAFGRAISGRQAPLATDADCGALAAAALR